MPLAGRREDGTRDLGRAMNWDKARRLMRLGRCEDQSRRPTRSFGPGGHLDPSSDVLADVRARSICVVSGKGGTGKSLVTASLASLAARRRRTLVVDGDLGVGNAHILQNVSPEHSFAEVVDGVCQVHEIVTPCRENLDLLGAGSGYAKLAGLSTYELHMIACGIEKLELTYDTLLLDSAAGISEQTVSFAAAADLVLIVTTPDVTAMTDAYAFLKVLIQRRPTAQPLLVVNRAADLEEASGAASRLLEVSQKFLGREPRWIGTLPEDRAAFRSVQRRSPVVEYEPESDLALALIDLAATVDEELYRTAPRGLGRMLLRHVTSAGAARLQVKRATS